MLNDNGFWSAAPDDGAGADKRWMTEGTCPSRMTDPAADVGVNHRIFQFNAVINPREWHPE